MKLIKAFIFTKAQLDPGWSYSEVDNLESLSGLIAAGIAQRMRIVVHIGFVCPDIQSIAAMAEPWPDALLLSDSAATAFPVPLTLSSFPVGSIGGVSFHIVIQGFGRNTKDPFVGVAISPEKESLLHGSDLPGAGDWVGNLIKLKPRLALVLQDAGIVDEETYLDGEKFMPQDMRREVGIDRFVLKAGVRPSAVNIIEHLRDCPPW